MVVVQFSACQRPTALPQFSPAGGTIGSGNEPGKSIQELLADGTTTPPSSLLSTPVNFSKVLLLHANGGNSSGSNRDPIWERSGPLKLKQQLHEAPATGSSADSVTTDSATTSHPYVPPFMQADDDYRKWSYR